MRTVEGIAAAFTALTFSAFFDSFFMGYLLCLVLMKNLDYSSQSLFLFFVLDFVAFRNADCLKTGAMKTYLQFLSILLLFVLVTLVSCGDNDVVIVADERFGNKFAFYL